MALAGEGNAADLAARAKPVTTNDTVVAANDIGVAANDIGVATTGTRGTARMTCLRVAGDVRILFAFLLWMASATVNGQALSGVVRDAATGEGIGSARLRLSSPMGAVVEVICAADGRFQAEIPSGAFTLQATVVGYRPYRATFTREEGQPMELELRLVTDTLRRRDSTEVVSDVFAREESGAVTLSGTELRNLASVLADDPLRAVQGLPGVASNNDFQSQFSIRGAGFERVGIYLDGILLRSPFHAVQGESSSASLTVLNGDFLDSVALYTGAPPSVYMDRSAGALDVRTREGARDGYHGRLSAGFSNAAATMEGPLDGARRGGWLVSARRSYLQYIINRTTDEPALGFGFWDVQGKADYSLTRKHRVSVGLVQGHSGLDRSGAESRVGQNAILFSGYNVTLANLHSSYTPGNRWLLSNRLAYMRERFQNENRERQPLAEGFHGEWIFNSDTTFSWNEQAPLQFGVSVRRLRDDGYQERVISAAPFRETLNRFRGTGLRSGGYVQQSLPIGQRVSATVGARVDGHSLAGPNTVSPTASLRAQLLPGTSLQVATGSYAQYPEISRFRALFGRDSLLPERAIHHQLAIEQRLTDKLRLRAEIYNRLDRDLLFRPFSEPRLLQGVVFNPLRTAPLENSLRGYARGLQVFLQRRSVNGLTGWASYSYGVARLRDGVSGQHFYADFDQRHTVNLFGSYRLRPTLNLSLRHTYGSGFPIPGFLVGTEDNFRLAPTRNNQRIPSYLRTDLRLNKTWIHKRAQYTFFLETVNLTNRRNIRFESLANYNRSTGTARVNLDRLLPLIPSAGLAVDF
jgi:hypothetical protein